MVSPFGQPLLCLLSPTSTPAAIKYDPARSGSLFTLFLYSPIKAVASIAGYVERSSVESFPRQRSVLVGGLMCR